MPSPAEFSERDFTVARQLYVSGYTLNDFRFEDGTALTHLQMKRLHRLTFNHRISVSGRESTVDKHGGVKWGSYDCDVCLAGGVFLASTREFYGKIPIVPPSGRCDNPRCVASPALRTGGGYDGIVIVLPHDRVAGLFHGEWPVNELGTLRSWSEDYLYAVRSSEVARAILTTNKLHTLYARYFSAKSRFQEAIMFMCRMRGLQDVAFYHYAEAPLLFDGLVSGAIGHSAMMRSYFDRTIDRRWNHMTQYAWGLYDLCRYGMLYPDVQLPLAWYCTNINRVSKHTKAACESIQAKYKEQVALVSQRRVVQLVDDRGFVIPGLVCAECQIFYGATVVLGVGVGVHLSDAQLLRVDAGLKRAEYDQYKIHSFRVPVSRPGCDVCGPFRPSLTTLPVIPVRIDGGGVLLASGSTDSDVVDSSGVGGVDEFDVDGVG